MPALLPAPQQLPPRLAKCVERTEQDLYLSTLSAYVSALGGRLELTAVFPDQSVQLKLPGSKRVA